MTLPLRDVLEHAALAPAEPILRTGAEHTGRMVRWLHSSEVLEIAPLLRGGELLLTGGVVLATSGVAARRRYIHELAARGVAAVAIETGPQLPHIPPEVLDEADRCGFPVVELRRIVPFVSIAEQVNGMLVHESVRRLRTADAISHALSSAMTEGADLPELVGMLATAVRGAVVLLDAAGTPLATSGDCERPQEVEATPGAVSVPVTVHGSALARLVTLPEASTGRDELDPLLHRATEVLALALARAGVAAPEDRAVYQLLQHLDGDEPAPERTTALALAAGLPEAAPVVGVAAQGAGELLGIGSVDAVLRRRGRRLLANVTDGALSGLVVLPPSGGVAGREALLADLAARQGQDGVRVGVGPATHGFARMAHTLAEARHCLGFAAETGTDRQVIDTAEFGVELLLWSNDTAAGEFIEDQLGPLLELEPARTRTLVATLEAYFRCGCSKTATAAAMHVQRQALYQRLRRIFTLIGGDPSGTARALNIHLAARLYLGETITRPSGRTP